MLSPGLFCDSCQNRFGSEVEQQALGDYPFSFFRVMLGIPTKKGRAPWFDSWEGKICASPRPGVLGYDPAPHFADAAASGRKTEIRILAHPIHPDMVCRTLLKMALEVIANDDREVVFHKRYDRARKYALDGKKEGDWWYLQREDMRAAARFITMGVCQKDREKGIRLSVIDIEDDAEVFHLQLLYLDMFVPLHPRIQPPPADDLPEPEYRMFRV